MFRGQSLASVTRCWGHTDRVVQVSVHLQVLPDVGVHAHSGWMKLNGNRLIVDVILFFVTDSVIV